MNVLLNTNGLLVCKVPLSSIVLSSSSDDDSRFSNCSSASSSVSPYKEKRVKYITFNQYLQNKTYQWNQMGVRKT